MTTDLLRNHWHRIGAAAAAVAGLVFLIVGWWGVSGADLTTEQIPYLASGAVGGLFLLGIASTLWVSADLRDEYLKLDDIYQVVEHLENVARPGPWSGAEVTESEMSQIDSTPVDDLGQQPQRQPRNRARTLRAGSR